MNKYQEALHKVYFPFVSVITDKKHVAIAEAFATLQELVDQASRPTADEVCKALSEHLERNVKMDIDNTFYYSDKNGLGEYDEIICGYGWGHEHHTIAFEIDLPPHLITLIGRFYEGVEKVGKEE
jgi:hypothetical protein